MKLEFKVIRHRLSNAEGEAEVLCNGVSIMKFGDNIKPGGKIANIDGYGSVYEDEEFVKSVVRDYNHKILALL